MSEILKFIYWLVKEVDKEKLDGSYKKEIVLKKMTEHINREDYENKEELLNALPYLIEMVVFVRNRKLIKRLMKRLRCCKPKE